MALLSLLAVFRLSVREFTNRELRQHLAPLLGIAIPEFGEVIAERESVIVSLGRVAEKLAAVASATPPSG